jgi:hypothetical protein
MLTAAQLTDVRRFAGYAAYGTTQPAIDIADTVFVHYGTEYMSLYTRLTTLSAPEEAVLTGTFLTNLNLLESAIPGAADNLDTEEAAVWQRGVRPVGAAGAMGVADVRLSGPRARPWIADGSGNRRCRGDGARLSMTRKGGTGFSPQSCDRKGI